MDKKKLILWVPIVLVLFILVVAALVAIGSSYNDEGDPMAPGPINTTSTPTPRVEA